jgi:hypothetical protein
MKSANQKCQSNETGNNLFFFFKMTRASKDTTADFLKNRMRDYRTQTRDAKWGEEGRLLENIVLNRGKDVKHRPALEGLESARHWASDKFYGNDDETIPAEFRGKNRYLVEDRDLNNDGDPEVVIRRNHDKSIYAINGYRVVPSKHHQRRAYFDLFPNPVARQQARDDRITQKNYIKRLPKYYEETLRRAPDAYHESAKGRIGRIKSKSILEKLTKQKISLPEALHYFFFDLGWQAFKHACQTLIENDPTKQRAQYWKKAQAFLFGFQAKVKSLVIRSLVIQLGELNPEDVEFVRNPDVKIAQFLRASPQIVDRVWLKFIRDLFNGDTSEERIYFQVLVNSAFSVFPEFFEKIDNLLAQKQAKVQEELRVGNYTDHEQGIIFAQFQEQYQAIGLVAQLLGNNGNAERVFQTGLQMPVDNQNNSLVDAMTRRMTANLVKMPGIQGGGKAGKPVGVDGSRPEITAQLEHQTGTTETGGDTDQPRDLPASKQAELAQASTNTLQGAFPGGTPAIGFTPQPNPSSGFTEQPALQFSRRDNESDS